MESARVSSAALQALTGDFLSARSRVSSGTMQVAYAGPAQNGRVASATLQAALSIPAEHSRVVNFAAQVARSTGGDGAMARVGYAALQTVWVTGPQDGTRQRAWTFDFDGHTFYVLDLADRGALIFDTLTGQWSKFVTEGYDGGWNFKNGFQWTTGGVVVGGEDGTGRLLQLTPQNYLDEGWRPVVYEVRGILPTKSIDFISNYSLRMIGSAGVTADSVAPVMRMQYSDDRGETWSSEWTLELTANTEQRIEFRSLGAFCSPGRIFRIYDQGGIQFIAAVEAETGAG